MPRMGKDEAREVFGVETSTEFDAETKNLIDSVRNQLKPLNPNFVSRKRREAREL